MKKRQNTTRVLAAAAALAVPVVGLAGQAPAGRLETATEARLTELRRTDELVDALTRTDELAQVSRTPDRHLSERVHQGFMQYHEGVPVLGGGVSRQLAAGVTVSVFGTLNEGILGHAYFLAVEGGTNRTSGLSVAWVNLVPSFADHAIVRQSLIRSATDLFGADAAATRAIREALDAVGIPHASGR